MKNRVVYPGSFDPITNGHMDIIHRAYRIFPDLIVSVAENPRKESLFSSDEKIDIINKVLNKRFGKDHTIRVEKFSGLLMDYMGKKKASVVIRGLRALSDFEYEFQMALNNRRLKDEVETLFLMTSEPYMSVSSGIIKEIAYFDGDISGMVPKYVEKCMKEKIGQIKKENLGN